jgi:putative ABC transport system substrate-binding protein
LNIPVKGKPAYGIRCATVLGACPLLGALLVLLLVPSLSYALEVAVVKSEGISPYTEVLEGFRSSCNCTVREINLTEYGRSDVAGRIEDMEPDAVLAIGTDAFMQVKGLSVPVFYAMVLPSASPADNKVSGVSMLVSPDLYFSHIAALFPDMKRVGVIHDPHATGAYIRAAGEAARARGMELVVKEVRRLREVQPALESLRGKIDLLLLVPDTGLINSETINSVLLFSFQHRVPLFAFSRKYVEMGALAALNINARDIGVQAGELVRMRLPGEKNKAPVQTDARKATLSFNRKVARKLGIKVREQGLRGAEEISLP